MPVRRKSARHNKDLEPRPIATRSGTVSAPQPARSLLDSPLLPWGLVALGLVSGFAGPLGEALHALRLPDTDDAMRLAQVRDLVAGQSWFDMVQHRFLPPEGVASHWSRLIDAPLAASIAGLTPLVGAALAERLTTAFWPPLLFVAYAAVLHRGMARLFPARAAVLALFAATQTAGLVLQFAPGRIDHHNLQIVLIAGMALALMQPERTWRVGALAGGLAALSLAVGLEALPLIAAAGLVVLADWIVAGRPALPPFLGFALALALGATALFGVQTAPGLWATSACDALSPPWLWIAGTGAAVALGAFAARPSRPAARLGLALGIGALCLAGFSALFPACLRGPFPDMSEFVRTNWLTRIREMQPLAAMLHDRPGEALGLTACLFVAAVVAVVLAIRDAARRRPFAVAALFLWAGAVQTLFQLRGIYVASAFVPLIAGVCLDRALTFTGPVATSAGVRAAFLAAAIALNGQVWLVAGQMGERLAGIGSAQGAPSGIDACSEPAALRPLDALPAGTVLAPIDLGPYLLVHTRHAVAAAPYHRALAGLSASLEAFAGEEADLRRQAERTGAHYLVVCPGASGKAFAARLGRGEVAPDWLEPVPLPGSVLKAWRLR